MSEELSKITDLFKPKKYGIAAKREAAQKAIAELDPTSVPNKLAIVFDDSGSMSGQKIKDAHAGVQGFTNQCNARDTSIAIYPLNADPKPLTCNYDVLNMLVSTIGATGGTPLFSVTQDMLNDPADFTRAVLFSDGEPNYEDMQDKEDTINLAKEKETPLDTIFIGEMETEGYRLMKEIAEKTGGIFIYFKDSSSLSTGLKYLTPGLRGLLANPDIKAKIERGESI